MIVDARNLRVEFRSDEQVVYAVRGVDLRINRGERVGFVGESGSGKTALTMSLARLLPLPQSHISADKLEVCGVEVLHATEAQMQNLRGAKVGYVFQESMSSLNPVLRIGDQIAEVIELHRPDVSLGERNEMVKKLLDSVGIRDSNLCMQQYPHELSGGMQQRVVIAVAIACRPELIVADEPTTALDVAVAKQVLAQLLALNKELGSSLLLISHDIRMLMNVCSRIYVMYAGKVVEELQVGQAASDWLPKHPYARALLDCMPRPNDVPKTPLRTIPGSIPSITTQIPGCAFADRCSRVEDRCRTEEPELVDGVRCWRPYL